MIDLTKCTDDELKNLSNDIEVELMKRKNAHYKNHVSKVIETIYDEIDDTTVIAFNDSFHDWTWEEIANSIEFYTFK